MRRATLTCGGPTTWHRAFGVGVVFIAIAVVAALFGFGIISEAAPLSAKMFAAFFLLSAAAAFGWVWMNRPRLVA